MMMIATTTTTISTSMLTMTMGTAILTALLVAGPCSLSGGLMEAEMRRVKDEREGGGGWGGAPFCLLPSIRVVA